MKSKLQILCVIVLVASQLLVACAPAAPATEVPVAEAPAVEAPVAEAPVAAVDVNWKQYEGTTLNLLLISHPFVDALKPLLPEFEAKTGMKVNLEVLAEQPGFEKLLSDLSSGTGSYDAFMTDPLHNWQYATAGWVEPLDSYLTDPTKTNIAEYDQADFMPGIWNAGKWTLVPMEGMGEGQTWAVPINFESYLLAYRPSILKEKGIAVPTTYDEYYEAAKALTYEKDGQKVYGTITRFDKYWDLTYLTFGTMLQSYGAGLLDEQGNVAVCSPQSIAATELFIKTIKDTSPEGAAAFTWYEALQGFASGQYAMSLDEADLFAPTYENPEESQISEDVGYALTPLGPDGKRLAGAWVWEMSINSASKNKDAAWLFLQWLTSKDVITRTNIAGNMNPVRASSWESAELMSIVEKWGETPGQYIEVMKEMGKVAAIRFPPHPELTRALDRWAEAIQSSYFEGGNVETNLCAAQEDIAKILGK